MHILFISDNFPPEINAPATRTFEHCREWVSLGFTVTVITCVPNFPSGKVFKGYKNKLWQSEVMDGVRVIRVWTFIVPNEGTILRALDYISFMISAILPSLCIKKIDVIIGTSPQFFSVCAACIVGKLKRIPWIFELRDIWPESIKAVGAIKHGVLLKFFERIEIYLYKHASAIIVVTNSFKTILISRGIDKDKITVVTNGVDLRQFTRPIKDINLISKLGLSGKFIVGYIGTHGLAQALEVILNAAQKIQSRLDQSDIHFLFIGNGAKKRELVNFAESNKIKNVTFLDSVPRSEVFNYWSILDASIIHLRKNILFESVIPSKLFECMAMGIPVAHGVDGESAEIVLNNKVGETFSPENITELINIILRFKQSPLKLIEYKNNGIERSIIYDRRKLALNVIKVINKIKDEL